MQQTFVSAYRSLLAGSEPRRADVWLAAIARNECLDRIRARMREPLAEHGRNGRSEAPDALAALIAGEEFRALSRSIEQLPAQQREALLLHEFCGLPYGEVAAAIGVSESAIGSLLFRARRSLRSAFRRGYAVLPLPEIWNASAQLLARGPAIKVAALPMVAKVGCGAVAVGLTAGAVVAVDHEVGRSPGRVPFRTSRRLRRRCPCESACARQPAGGREVGGPGVGDGDRWRRSPPSVPLGRRLRVASTGLVPSPRPRPARLCPRRSRRSWSHPPRHHPRDQRDPGVRQEQLTRLDRERTRQRATKPRQVARKDVHEAARQAEGRAADTGWWEPTPSSRRTEPAATAPGLARGHDEHGPPGKGETVDASAPSADAPPSESSTDHPATRTSRAPRPPGQELSSRRDRCERDERPADKFSEARPERRPLVRGRELDRRARASQRGAKQRRRPTGVPAGRDQDDPPRPHLARDRRGGGHIRERRP